MKLLSRECFITAMLAGVATPIMAELELVEECIPVHQTLNDVGASKFSEMLLTRGLDFKYGHFTIFAPTDKLLGDQMLLRYSEGHTSKTIDDILLFHVSAETITEDITDTAHCGKPLLMLNEELHVNQETSTTKCDEEKVFQYGPGNDSEGVLPEVIGDPVTACDSVIYVIEDMIMLPTLPEIPVVPTEAPAATKAPTRQDPPAPFPTDESGSHSLSLAFTAFAGLIMTIL